MRPTTRWDQAKNILCIRLDNMGDVLMTTPAMMALKSAGTSRRITLLASPSGAALSPYLNFLEKTITYDAPWVKNDKNDPSADESILSQLRQEKFDAAVIFTVYSQSPLPAALLCRMAGIPLVLAHCRENPYQLLSDWIPESEPESITRHESQRQLDLVKHVQAYSADPRLVFKTKAIDRVRLYEKLNASHIRQDVPWIVAHCGATAASRRYPVEHYIEAMRLLGGRAGQIILTGDASEQELTRQIIQKCATHAPLFDFAGRLALGEFACLIENASLLLSNNTGPVHIAAAVGTPIVDLYALTNPQHTPWMVPNRVLSHDVPCKNCYRSVCPEKHHNCLRLVTPKSVRDAVMDLLTRTKGPIDLRAAG
ncbi:glycosyl transferase [Advenella kashmirensis W13003]|uniref:Glycosyl transferase n=1 Tax=Advenella kashmirensis W13003 TaxID=1424334 RepID=V8QVI0_9BURK|nr:glycosyltransferase family 9 protein [Advenella kashmirensis]ETF03642.1 glycosyl transferase [Advenella kashmirensis W13003]